MNQKNVAHETYNNGFKQITQRKNNGICRRLISRIIGAKNLYNIMPIVYADNKKQESTLKGYKDLPIYPDPSIEDCKTNEKFYCVDDIGLYESLVPVVVHYRKQFESLYTSSVLFTRQIKSDVCRQMCKMKCKFQCHFQNEDKLLLRQFVVALGTIAGYALGSPKRGLIYRRVFWAAIGNLMTGALCFPKETDENLRNISFELAKKSVVLFNWWFDTKISITRNHDCKSLVGEPCLPTQEEADLCVKILQEREKNLKKLTFVDKVQRKNELKEHGRVKKEKENEEEQEGVKEKETPVNKVEKEESCEEKKK